MGKGDQIISKNAWRHIRTTPERIVMIKSLWRHQGVEAKRSSAIGGRKFWSSHLGKDSNVLLEPHGISRNLTPSSGTVFNDAIVTFVDVCGMNNMCIRDLDNLNLAMLVWFRARPNFRYWLSCLKKYNSLQKWSKVTQK